MLSRTLLSRLTILHQCHSEIQWLLSACSKSTTAGVFPQGNRHHIPRMPAARQTRRQVVLEKMESAEAGLRMIKVDPAPARMECQSVLLPGPERIRASISTDTPEEFLAFPDSKTHIVGDALQSGMKLTSNGECLGFRSPAKTGKYKWISYAEVEERKTHIASGLINLGLSPSQKSMVGICTRSRPEFILTLFACADHSMVLVPVYHCFGPDVLAHIINQVDMEVIIVENLEIATEIIKNADKYPTLKHIILIEDPESEDPYLNTERFNIITLNQIEIMGKSCIHPPNLPKPDDLFCIIYTSGTTGEPKGVMVTHKNLLSSIAALNTVFGDSAPMTARVMCYLPCAHIYEIVNEVFGVYKGGQLGFYSGKTENILSDIQELEPTVLPLVPKLMNLIYSGVKRKIGPNFLRRSLFRMSMEQNEKKLKQGIISKTAILDKLVLWKIQKVLGGNLQMVLSSSAPISREVMRFFRCSMGCGVYEAYGLSEVGAATMTLISEHDTGFVGPPLPCNHVKLVDVPELSYMAKNDIGEICIKGANVFKGYYKNPEATTDAIDKDGWYHTGDIGRWLTNGSLSVIDRKKHIFKMSQGEYIAPEKMEGVYIQSHIISQVFVDGHSDQDFAVAVVVPDKSPFMKWASEEGFKNQSFEELCQNEDLKKVLLSHMVKIGKRKNLNSLHQVGNIYVCYEPFTKENDLLTPTMKLKRQVARKAFEKEFLNLYKEGNLRKIHDL